MVVGKEAQGRRNDWGLGRLKGKGDKGDRKGRGCQKGVVVPEGVRMLAGFSFLFGKDAVNGRGGKREG